VDDDASLRMLIEAVFQDTFDVSVAKTGKEALRKATLEKPDVMLLDLHLPDIPGTEVAERLRRSADTSLIPLIMLTGDDSMEVESLRAGVDAYMTKPFDETVLQLRVESILRRSGGRV
jgi:DNA-binding response OmpR family regulator